MGSCLRGYLSTLIALGSQIEIELVRAFFGISYLKIVATI